MYNKKKLFNIGDFKMVDDKKTEDITQTQNLGHLDDNMITVLDKTSSDEETTKSLRKLVESIIPLDREYDIKFGVIEIEEPYLDPSVFKLNIDLVAHPGCNGDNFTVKDVHGNICCVTITDRYFKGGTGDRNGKVYFSVLPLVNKPGTGNYTRNMELNVFLPYKSDGYTLADLFNDVHYRFYHIDGCKIISITRPGDKEHVSLPPEVLSDFSVQSNMNNFDFKENIPR